MVKFIWREKRNILLKIKHFVQYGKDLCDAKHETVSHYSMVNAPENFYEESLQYSVIVWLYISRFSTFLHRDKVSLPIRYNPVTQQISQNNHFSIRWPNGKLSSSLLPVCTYSAQHSTTYSVQVYDNHGTIQWTMHQNRCTRMTYETEMERRHTKRDNNFIILI